VSGRRKSARERERERERGMKGRGDGVLQKEGEEIGRGERRESLGFLLGL